MSRSLKWIALISVVIGTINAGLVGLARIDLGAALFGGSTSALSRAVYSLVGLAGLSLLAMRFSTVPGLVQYRQA